MSQPPITPNGIGQVVTSASDLHKHAAGTSLRHVSTSIDLSTPILVNGADGYNVQDTLTLLNNYINTVSSSLAPNATSSVAGVIKLNGDLSGTYSSPIVAKINGRSVSSTAPSAGNVLTFDGSSWGPAAAAASFTAGGDLGGTNTSQTVVSLTGKTVGGGVSPGNPTIATTARTLLFTGAQAVQAIISAQNAAGTVGSGGANLSIWGQTTTTGDSGNVIISGGYTGDGTSRSGTVTIQTEQGTNTILEASSDANGHKKILGLFSPVAGTSVMPANSGDGVIYLHNATTAPTTGSPVGGAIIYSSSGKVKVKQSDGYQVTVGDYYSNPNTWGTPRKNVYTSNFSTSYIDSSKTQTTSFNFNNGSYPGASYYTYVIVTMIVVSNQSGEEASKSYRVSSMFQTNSLSTTSQSSAGTNVIDSIAFGASFPGHPTLGFSGNYLTITYPGHIDGSAADPLNAFVTIEAYNFAA